MKGWVGLVGGPTADGLPTSGHLSVADWAQDRESSPVRDRCSTTVPRSNVLVGETHLVGTWTNWLTFEPDPDHSPDARTGLLSPISYKRCYSEFYIGENPIGGARPERAVVLKWFYALSRLKTFVGGKCALPSTLLVFTKGIVSTAVSLLPYSLPL